MTNTPLPSLPTVLPDVERTPAIITHLSPLLGYALPSVGHLLGPLLAWLVYRDRSAALDAQGKEALNFQLSLTLYGVLLTGLLGVLFAFGMLGGILSSVAGTGGMVQSGDAAPMFAGFFGTILGFFGPFAAFFVLFIPMTLLLSLFPLVAMLIGVSRASHGEGYRYPLTIRFLR